ncbi:MAG: response regulator [Archangium sp.]|nr:response regulator [Archangium sp.]
MGDTAAAPRHDDDARFRLFFERSSDAILLLDTATNQFVQYNDATLEMLRCTREELASLHPSALSPATQPDGQDSFTKANKMIAAAVAVGTHRFEWTHCSPHRPDFPVEVVLTPVTKGEAPMLMVVWRDITERKRAEEAQRKTQKLESLGLLAGGIAHDFNNLLAAILGNLSLARLEVPPGNPALDYLKHMEAAVDKAAHLTRQMLAYSGQGSLTIKPVDLAREVREMADLLSASVPKGVKLVYEAQGEVPPVRADAAQLGQVIMNLVINAAESILPRNPASAPLADGLGTVTLHTGSVTLSEAQIIRDFEGQSVRPGLHALLRVTDTGSGMSREVQAQIFDPFFSTKKSGRGLGLSALMGIVRAHKGGVLLDSEPGRGTTFTVYLPASAEPLLPPDPRPATALETEGGRVLLVEDEPMVRRSTRNLLEALGFSVVEAADGDEAIEVFKAERATLRWVLMDLTMPRMDGHTAFLALQKIDPSVKVVLSSGWAAADVVERFRGHPPAGFLSKPFVLAEILATLHQAGIVVKR